MAKVHTLVLSVAVLIAGQETPHLIWNKRREDSNFQKVVCNKYLVPKEKKGLSVDLLLTL